MTTHKFKATFWHGGKYISTILEAGDFTQARRMLDTLFPGASSVTVQRLD
jgi:hypothetical protein